ncbi:nitrate- and nitrite sensing domain-containing protein [Asanoa sp. NPDC049518]|uniref:sensor histidine kinase n=1 Tax=unclassified Asanoa TaxID=2685164 RepID=UPI0034189DAA
MSKRPKTANSFMSRLRRPAGRLRDLPIWSKLGLIMIVPTLATIVVGTNGLIDHIDTSENADQARDLAVVVEASGDLVQNLQNERAAAAMLLGAEGKTAITKYKTAFESSQQAVDRVVNSYSTQRASLNDLPTNFTTTLAQIDDGLQGLPGVRSQVTSNKFAFTDAARAYNALVDNLLNLRDGAAQLAANTSLSERMRAVAAVARQKEFLSQERLVVLQAYSAGGMNQNLKKEFIASQTGQLQAAETFISVATVTEEEQYNQTVAGSDLRSSTAFAGWITGVMPANGALGEAPFKIDSWDSALLGHSRLIRSVERRLDNTVVDTATTLRDDVQRQVLIETGLLLAMLLLAILFAWLVARSMARSLRELRHGALAVAQYGLPQAVSRLRDPALSTQMSPAQLANQIAEPLPVRSKDEFGQVTEAFNAVHLEAVRTAAEQAALRASVATMFVNLARRSQILVDRLIGHLDRLERGEEDPDRLAELFQLDHLATRMRRNDENLLVLAGADSTRIQREPAALIDVLRAAQSEVEHYTRIEFGVIDRDIEVAAHAVNDLVHLVAELFDNATAFSPPDSSVMVEARRIGEHAVLYVEDRGIGITADQLNDLNERLATPPMVDVAVSRMMGLVVVARLAARHGVKVELRPASDRGTVADVALPTSVLVPRGLTGRSGSGAFELPVQQPAQPQQPSRSPFPAPLALESGPMTRSDRELAGASGGLASAFGGRPGDAPSNGSNGFGSNGNGNGRSGGTMPAWSDLTGAGPQGGGRPSDPFGGPRDESLPNRRPTDGWAMEGEVTAGPQSPAIPRQTPRDNGTSPVFSAPPMISVPPVISVPPSSPGPAAAPRQPEPWEQGGPTLPPSAPAGPPIAMPDSPVVPGRSGGLPGRPTGQPESPSTPFAQPPAAVPPPAAAPQPAAPFAGGSGFAGSPAGGQAPPAWPPVAAEPQPAVDHLAAAVDMTAELPRVERPAAAQAAPAAPAAQQQPAVPPIIPAANKARFADETMELPIFRELESAWFRTRRAAAEESSLTTSAPSTAAAAPAATAAPSTADARVGGGGATAAPTQQFATVEATQRLTSSPQSRVAPAGGSATGSGLPTRPSAPSGPPPQQPHSNGLSDAANGNGAARRPEPQESWQTAADDGWRAASAISEMEVNETTTAGLPKRVPMAQLVPGGVDKSATSVQKRTPEAVRGLLSAYHRGVQRGRTQPKDETSDTTPAGQPSQAGHGPGAGSGQKEHER